MLKKQTYFIVGLFVTVGILLGAAAIIWVSTSQYFKKGTTYVTYFDESVQGLQVDSIVKYRGVDVGRVQKIGVAPDFKLIEVTMKIDFKGDVMREAVAKLQLAGITGIVFIDLDRIKPGSPTMSPQITFPTEYPVIQSRPSDIQQISSGIGEIVGKIKKVDFQDISEQIVHTTRSLEEIIGGPSTRKIITNLESVTASLSKSTAKIDKVIQEGHIEGVIGETKEALKEAKMAMGKVSSELESLNLARTVNKADFFLDTTAKKTQSVLAEVRVLLENLRNASETLTVLADRLNADPSEIIFSSPPQAARSKKSGVKQ
jgi:phospholipid/cholesterol/gamma-HCH transport system substrate-binding protein